jgi:hypothetical protein
MTDTLYIFYNQQQEFICESGGIDMEYWVSSICLGRVVWYRTKKEAEYYKDSIDWKYYNINIDDFIITPIKLKMELV